MAMLPGCPFGLCSGGWSQEPYLVSIPAWSPYSLVFELPTFPHFGAWGEEPGYSSQDLQGWFEMGPFPLPLPQSSIPGSILRSSPSQILLASSLLSNTNQSGSGCGDTQGHWYLVEAL